MLFSGYDGSYKYAEIIKNNISIGKIKGNIGYYGVIRNVEFEIGDKLSFTFTKEGTYLTGILLCNIENTENTFLIGGFGITNDVCFNQSELNKDNHEYTLYEDANIGAIGLAPSVDGNIRNITVSVNDSVVFTLSGNMQALLETETVYSAKKGDKISFSVADGAGRVIIYKQ